MNRISGKPLKTRDFGTLDVAGIPCLLLGCAKAAWEQRMWTATVVINLNPSERYRRGGSDTLEKKQFL